MCFNPLALAFAEDVVRATRYLLRYRRVAWGYGMLDEEKDKEKDEEVKNGIVLGPNERSTILLFVGILLLGLNHSDAISKGFASVKLLVIGVTGVAIGIGGYFFPHIYQMRGPNGERTTKTALLLAGLSLVIAWALDTFYYSNG